MHLVEMHLLHIAVICTPLPFSYCIVLWLCCVSNFYKYVMSYIVHNHLVGFTKSLSRWISVYIGHLVFPWTLHLCFIFLISVFNLTFFFRWGMSGWSWTGIQGGQRELGMCLMLNSIILVCMYCCKVAISVFPLKYHI